MLGVWGGGEKVAFVIGMVVGGRVTLVVRTNLGLTPKSAGALGSLVLLIGIISRPTGGYLVGRLGVRTLLTVSLSLNAIACLSMAAAPRSFGIVIGAIVVLGVGCGLPYAAMFTRAAALFPGRAGAAMGLVNMLGIVMILVGAPLVGRLVDVTKSYTSSFVALGVFSLLILVTSQFIHRDARV